MNITERIIGKLTSIKDARNPPRLDRNLLSRISRDSLLFYFGNIHSQRGQDSILFEIFRRIGIDKGFFVEFGAWDGVYLSNARYLYERGWSGVFIEADSRKFQSLLKEYPNDTVKINAMVGAPTFGVKGSSLKDLLKQNGVAAEDVTFVSIDVDGPDLEIFQDMGFRPPVVLIEGGFNWSPYFDSRISVELACQNMQQPLPIIVRVANDLGYDAVCFYQDTFLVRKDFGLTGKNAVELYSDAFHFIPSDFRRSLIELRTNNPAIRDLEQKFFGQFHGDPLGYAG